MRYSPIWALSLTCFGASCSSRVAFEVNDPPYTGGTSSDVAAESSGSDAGITSEQASSGPDASSGSDPFAEVPWAIPIQHSGAAFMGIHGTDSKNVWIVGADDGSGPVVLHFDGRGWERKHTGARADLWWVHTFEDGTTFLAGSEGTVLKYQDEQFVRQRVPALGKDIVFGVWGYSPRDMYAVGSSGGVNGFIWHLDGAESPEWQALTPPPDVPRDNYRDIPAFFKVWGNQDGVWVVGDRGLAMRGAASQGFSLYPSHTERRLFTVHGNSERAVVVGGDDTGVLFEGGGEEGLHEETPENCLLLQGTYVTPSGVAWATGADGFVYRQQDERTPWQLVDTGLSTPIQSLHAMWVSPEGAVWAVGGNVVSSDLDSGVVVYRGPEIPTWTWQAPEPAAAVCPEDMVDPEPNTSIARRWNEQLLNAIRRDVPQPTVHARNLFHTSVAMWDAWATYDALASGYLTLEKQAEPQDLAAAREEAISYAAYRVLHHRYKDAIGGAVSEACFDAFMGRLGYEPQDLTFEGDGPRAVGNRIGQAVIDAFAEDGANEGQAYADPDAFFPDNPLLIVDKPGVDVKDPTLWQRLLLVKAVTQNGIDLGAGAQPYIGAHWRDVTPFALVRETAGAPYFDLKGPRVLDADLADAAVEVVRKTAELDVEDGEMMDISPGAYGNNSLGANDGSGHAVNPVTGRPYEPNRVLRGDFTRILAEFWADGPHSETPPGHWNSLANTVSYGDHFERKLFGAGQSLDPLGWDVHLYLALNGAVHDAAIAAWELKREFVTARPITLIRYMAELGQRTDSDLPSYHPDGLPLVPGLIELISEETTQPGGKHAHLARYVGELAIFSWRGEPGDRENEIGGVGWIRALHWIPYQRRTFVTPAFPGYISGHSTFSRAAAEVLTELTGSAYFPGGLGEFVAPAGYLVFEGGPAREVRLQWGTYYDAADQAGQSRLWGGIHIRNDDYDGRRVGSLIGKAAVDAATRFFSLP